MTSTTEAKSSDAPFKTTSFILLWAGLLMSIRVWWLIAQIPTYQRMYAHLGMELPIITKFIISFGFTLGILLGAAALCVFIKEFIVKNKRTTLALNGVYLLLVIGLNELLILGFLIPMQELLRIIENQRNQ